MKFIRTPTALLLILVLACASSCRNLTDDRLLTEHISHTGIRRLEIDADAFRVELVGLSGAVSAPDDLSGVMEIPELAAQRYYRVDAGREGDRFFIRVRARLVSRLFYKDNTGGPRIRLSVPPGVSVDLRTGKGSVRISNLAGPSLRIETVSGPIEITACSGSLSLRSGVGDVAIGAWSGDIEARTAAGDLTVLGLDGSCQAESTAGRMRISRSSGVLDLVNAVGAIVVEEFRATGSCSFRATTGSVEVDFTDTLDRFSFDLRSTTGRLLIGETEGVREIVDADGEIAVTGRTTTGRQVYR